MRPQEQKKNRVITWCLRTTFHPACHSASGLWFRKFRTTPPSGSLVLNVLLGPHPTGASRVEPGPEIIGLHAAGGIWSWSECGPVTPVAFCKPLLTVHRCPSLDPSRADSRTLQWSSQSVRTNPPPNHCAVTGSVRFTNPNSESELNCHGFASDYCKSNTISPICPSNPSQKRNQLGRQFG